jgi:hypothetical protein
MDYLRSLPVKNPGELPTIPVDERAAEVGAIAYHSVGTGRRSHAPRPNRQVMPAPSQ